MLQSLRCVAGFFFDFGGSEERVRLVWLKFQHGAIAFERLFVLAELFHQASLLKHRQRVFGHLAGKARPVRQCAVFVALRFGDLG